MKLSPFIKVVIIFVLSFFAAYISLPPEIPVSIHKGSVQIEKKIVRPGINIETQKISIKNNFELVLGLDLAGGSHLVFEAQAGNLGESERKVAMTSLRSVIERRVNFFGISEPNVQISSFEGKDRVIVELPGVKDTKEAIDLIGQTAQLSFAESGTEEEPGIFPTDLTGADLKKSDVTFDTNTGKPVVQLQFTDEGARKFAEITERNIGKPVHIFLDSDPVSSPIVQEKITGGSAIISGEFTLEAAKNLSIQLNAGALPVPVSLVEQRTVGATLGAESVTKSIRAGLTGLFMVLVFMVLAYGRLGVVANIALTIFGVLTLALYKLIPVVLTLPGIAGFLLSVGMAVDSNILIFERFKEERKLRAYKNALEVSFGRAWDSIRDANIATLVTAFILANPLDLSFLHTSGPVRGFAITLSLGILISLFTGIVVSRNLLRIFIKEKKIK
ncbi:protein-export membrane protein SecD [Candidatus Woesebacteria bacterium RIFCSPHIGHO2_01_FULL_39_32]|uniref:Protein translocase subunit SecD n=2 Tax=Candidatus Woeseibacteriota TaxID=1752722 RepID=A0A0G0PZT1_9BACT|nr:MAG: Preprotein translocase subunit SecD [Candidatus Woesebacteria bacterium GW2011_GWA1_39_8]OGM03785.1 MAG: protein-export membrane protein SecD [Candidatus Woesebacteria bacterium GWB1_37_5]OGM24250.1 MAG: protein-export membrane protein SecD [Candidatus Woesebacteria bacterium RIFCSPHIGHO2_01_FULL_39_32]OGM35377.1 MAG: protein-export membrane protein SecD [Candidatus Woesebacteria bacterium RIFCSPHIGHO2_12_FULL_38_11]OGM65321.1 MAG: protein-export membrane protein SecD [Candidatus Woeseb